MNDTLHTDWIENITFDELHIGQSAQMVRTLTLQDIQAFAAVSGDTLRGLFSKKTKPR